MASLDEQMGQNDLFNNSDPSPTASAAMLGRYARLLYQPAG